jgi:hypothetical protein
MQSKKKIEPPTFNIASRYYYFDAVQVRFSEPLDRVELDLMRPLCLKPLHAEYDKGKFGHGLREYPQLIQLRQPTFAALRLLEERNRGEYFINKVELAHDLILQSEEEVFEALEFFSMSWVQSHHGKTKRLNRIGNTHYNSTGGWVRNNYVLYPPKCCKITGEIDCLHLEWRISGTSAVRAVGIGRFEDMTNFDHEAFWQKKLKLFSANSERLGRSFLNHAKQSRRRGSWMQEWSGLPKTNIDARVGQLMMRASQLETRQDHRSEPARPIGSAQDLVDNYGPIARGALVVIPTDWLFQVSAEILQR